MKMVAFWLVVYIDEQADMAGIVRRSRSRIPGLAEFGDQMLLLPSSWPAENWPREICLVVS